MPTRSRSAWSRDVASARRSPGSWSCWRPASGSSPTSSSGPRTASRTYTNTARASVNAYCNGVTSARENPAEGAVASRRVVSERAQYLRVLVRRQIDQHKEEIAASSQRLLRLHPRRQLNEKLQYLDDLRSTLVRCTGQTMRHYLTKAQNLQFRFLRFKPSLIMAERKHQIVELYRSLRESAAPPGTTIP